MNKYPVNTNIKSYIHPLSAPLCAKKGCICFYLNDNGRIGIEHNGIEYWVEDPEGDWQLYVEGILEHYLDFVHIHLVGRP